MAIAVYKLADRDHTSAPLSRPVELICFALIVAHAVYLAACLLILIFLFVKAPVGFAAVRIRRCAHRAPRTGIASASCLAGPRRSKIVTRIFGKVRW
jgi:hypothetical protein